MNASLFIHILLMHVFSPLSLRISSQELKSYVVVSHLSEVMN